MNTNSAEEQFQTTFETANAAVRTERGSIVLSSQLTRYEGTNAVHALAKMWDQGIGVVLAYVFE